jgi:hypothetical protein
MTTGNNTNGIIMLSPPRSFSSVVSAMLGRHPQLYGVPELNLFVAKTMGGWYVLHTQHRNRPSATHGLLRVLAQLHEERQTEQSIENAWQWLAARTDWTTQRMWQYLSDLVYPKVLIDKSPITSMRSRFMEQALDLIPHAYFIHLTRHPIQMSKSFQENRERFQKKILGREAGTDDAYTPLEFWHHSHKTIMDFTSKLPEGQSIRVQGEKILEENDKYLAQLAEWLGLRSDEEALYAMKHPELSAYSCVGPSNARYGNDLKFLMSPELRTVSFRNPPIETHAFYDELKDESKAEVLSTAHQMGYG